MERNNEFFESIIMPGLPTNTPVDHVMAIKKAVSPLKAERDRNRFKLLLKTHDGEFNPDYIPTMKNLGLTDNIKRALIKQGAISKTIIPPTHYNSSQFRDILLAGNWSLLAQIFKSMVIIFVKDWSKTSQGDMNEFLACYQTVAYQHDIDPNEVAHDLHRLSPFPLYAVVCIKKGSPQAVYPIGRKSVIISESKSSEVVCIPLPREPQDFCEPEINLSAFEEFSSSEPETDLNDLEDISIREPGSDDSVPSTDNSNDFQTWDSMANEGNDSKYFNQ
jgi:hypothetical protein